MTPSPSHRLAVSNIAWDAAEDDAVAAVLRQAGVGGVEIAPTKWRERPLDAAAADVAAYRRAWEDRGLRVVSLQSLFFGMPNLQLFGDDASRVAMSDYLRRTIDLGAALGASVLVFGSPRNRVRGELPLDNAVKLAVEFLRQMAEHAHACGATICVEANPVDYGCDFINTTAEAVDLCRAIDHPGVLVNGDLGGMTMSGEDPGRSVENANHLLGHFHASEPNLAELGAGADHTRAAKSLVSIEYSGWVSIEMRAAGIDDDVASVQRAVRSAKTWYGTSD